MNATDSTPIAPAALHPEGALPATATHHYRFKPWNVGRVVIWSLFALVLVA